MAGLNAQSKGRRLGIFKPGKDEGGKAREKRTGEEFRIEVCGRAVPVVNTDQGVRAVVKGNPVEPEKVADYLERKFSADLSEVRSAMEDLAGSYAPEELADKAYPLYEDFRPDIPSGRKGWGAKGDLDLDHVRSLGG